MDLRKVFHLCLLRSVQWWMIHEICVRQFFFGWNFSAFAIHGWFIAFPHWTFISACGWCPGKALTAIKLVLVVTTALSQSLHGPYLLSELVHTHIYTHSLSLSDKHTHTHIIVQPKVAISVGVGVGVVCVTLTRFHPRRATCGLATGSCSQVA